MPKVTTSTRTQLTTEYAWTHAELAAYLPGFSAGERDSVSWWMDEGGELYARVISTEIDELEEKHE